MEKVGIKLPIKSMEHQRLCREKMKCCYKMWQASLATKCQNITKVSSNKYYTSSAFTVVSFFWGAILLNDKFSKVILLGCHDSRKF